MQHRCRRIRQGTRSSFRRIVRTPIRQRWRSPDDLAKAMACFRRAIRAHRRLARLAPHEFDVTVIEFNRREREERHARQAAFEPMLARLYGAPTPAEREQQMRQDASFGQPPQLSPRRQQTVEQEYLVWQLSMQRGKEAWNRYQQRRPHAVPSLGRIVRLLEIAMAFGTLAVGQQESPAAIPERPSSEIDEDLRHAYGHPLPADTNQFPEPTPLDLAGVESTSASPASSAPELRVSSLAALPQSPPGCSVVPNPLPRRDAWQRWARIQRRQMQ